MSISAEQAIALVQTHATAAINHYRSINEPNAGSPETNGARERRSAIALLTALLGRKPTDAEIDETLCL